MEAHLPALQVIIPLIAAPICLILRHDKLVWFFSLLISAIVFGIATQLLELTLASGELIYAIGGWDAPWGIEYRLDALNAFVLLIVSGISFLVLLFARTSIEKEIEKDKIYLFYTAYLLCLTGLLGIAITGDAFNLFVFLEISSLSSYALISMGKDRRALTASYQYLVMGTIGATFILIGIGLLYMMTGTLNMMDLSRRLPELTDIRTIRVAFAFLTVGISLKLALFPLHLWLPNAYTYAPSVVSVFLAATATKVAVYALLRFMFTVFGVHFSFESMPLTNMLIPLALIAILTASMVAITQDNIKRMLAYSSVAQIGYIILGISMVSITGLTGGIIHLFNHAIMKGALFMSMGCIVYSIGSVELKNFAGLGKSMPFTMAAFVVGGLSLIGIPLTAGFISKWYLVLAALEKGWWLIAILILLGSLLAVVYIWRVIEVAYFKQSENPASVKEAPLGLLIPTWLLVIANLYFGINANLTTEVASTAASVLLGGSSP